VEMAVPPTMVAGELSVEISEGETSGDDFSDGDFTDIDDLPRRVVLTERRVGQRWQAIMQIPSCSREAELGKDGDSIAYSMFIYKRLT